MSEQHFVFFFNSVLGLGLDPSEPVTVQSAMLTLWIYTLCNVTCAEVLLYLLAIFLTVASSSREGSSDVALLQTKI